MADTSASLTQSAMAAFADLLVDPVDHTPLHRADDQTMASASGNEYQIVRSTPILVPDASPFDVSEIAAVRPTTQSASYRSKSSIKNRVRQDVLPALSTDRSLQDRYRAVSQATAGLPALVLGAGDKIDRYESLFPSNPVISSDVHLQFGPHLVIDAHWIPFADASLGLVLAAQVLEHTIRPWRVSEEIERVLDLGGLAQIEVPFVFPLHSAPWDFYRFTVGGLRALFRRCELVRLDVPEGNFAAAATMGASALTSSFSGRYWRTGAVLGGRLGLGWMKHLDRWTESPRNRLASPKGLALTLRKDGVYRDDSRVIEETRALLDSDDLPDQLS